MQDDSVFFVNQRIDDLKDQVYHLSKQLEQVKRTVWFASGFFSALSFLISFFLK